MRRVIVWLGTGMTALLLFSAGIAHSADSEEKLTLDEVPKPIIAAVRARFGDVELTNIAKETKDSKVVYEASISPKDQNIDITLTPEAEIILLEQTIAADELPQPVKAALEDQYPKATYKIIEKVINVEDNKETLDYYEIRLLTADKRTLEIEVTPEGKITEQ